MKEITIILPIHEITNDNLEHIKNSVKSVEPFINDVLLYIVIPTTIKKEISEILNSSKIDFRLIENTTQEHSFTKQVNIGIDNVETEWFTILELDDEFHPSWFKNFIEYKKHNSDVDVFLPLIKDVDSNKNYINYTNESVWAYGFTENQGFLDNEMLLEYQNYQTSGGIYKTSIIKKLGKFKENFKLTFSYEFLLRLTHNGVKIMVIPRVGYIHMNFRENSLFWNYKNSETNKLSQNEAKFWTEMAKKEFFFTNNREIVYKEE